MGVSIYATFYWGWGGLDSYEYLFLFGYFQSKSNVFYAHSFAAVSSYFVCNHKTMTFFVGTFKTHETIISIRNVFVNLSYCIHILGQVLGICFDIVIVIPIRFQLVANRRRAAQGFYMNIFNMFILKPFP